eukprot:scaffold7271_cov107-Isochrysis_galbana.AAC.1
MSAPRHVRPASRLPHAQLSCPAQRLFSFRSAQGPTGTPDGATAATRECLRRTLAQPRTRREREIQLLDGKGAAPVVWPEYRWEGWKGSSRSVA